MDVTPQELRDIEIREAWRGYHRDDVDELLERAATSIEHLETQVRGLQERLAAAPPRAAVRPDAAPVPTPQPQPEPAPVRAEPARVPVADGDIIQRTLLMAQRAADEAVAEAQARAATLVAESEAKAQALVSDAESTARRIAESERRRIEAEIQELTATRDALVADVDALERFGSEYRDRVMAAVQAELDRLTLLATPAPPERPTLTSVAGDRPVWEPAPLAEVAPEPVPVAPAPAPEPVASYEPEPVPAYEPAPEPVRFEAEAATFDEAPPAWDAPVEPESWGDQQARYNDPSEPELVIAPASTPAPLDSLDDDAFFASLRDAVRDDAPLGAGRGGGFYDDDEDDDENGRKLFRRRR